MGSAVAAWRSYFMIKFRYLTGIKKICEEVIRNYSIWREFPIPVFRDKSIRGMRGCIDFRGPISASVIYASNLP
jgi:hypothetical protein